MATAAELEQDFEDAKNRRDAGPSHVLGVAKNVEDQIEQVQRSIDLGRNDGVPYDALLEGEAELKRLRSLLRRIEADPSTLSRPIEG
ncbi:MAG: hypothetical protein E6J91_46575 [Deltaproteobacteria bacterium]|nr:MAG: hypothetical protein E6J91_46575 [Deltaproteobacteria bacterium]